MAQCGKGSLPALTKRFSDESTQQEFKFTFYCDCCGTGYQSPPIPFSSATAESGATPAFIQKLLWQTEHEDAYERANQQAMRCFTKCAECGKWFCEDCLDEFAEIPLCPGCREKQKNNTGG